MQRGNMGGKPIIVSIFLIYVITYSIYSLIYGSRYGQLNQNSWFFGFILFYLCF